MEEDTRLFVLAIVSLVDEPALELDVVFGGEPNFLEFHAFVSRRPVALLVIFNLMDRCLGYVEHAFLGEGQIYEKESSEHHRIAYHFDHRPHRGVRYRWHFRTCIV